MKRAAVAEPELLHDVVLHGRRRRGRERDDGRGAKERQALAEHAVVGPEVVPPLRDAVRLVDRDERGLSPREHLGEARHLEPLGRDEEEVELPVEVGAAYARARPRAVAPGVDALGGEPLRPAAWRPGPPSAR